MDPLKEAFQKVKQDITSLFYEMDSLKISFAELNWKLFKLDEELKNLNKQGPPLSTHKPISKTYTTHPSTHDIPFKPLKTQTLEISTGNEGVPTDRQTHQQTDRQIEKPQKIPLQETIQPLSSPQPLIISTPEPNPIQDAAKILDSLDALKKEIRLKFKRLTEQEILAFSTLYQLDEQGEQVTYKTLAQRLNLTESSVRDYISRLITKGIPVEKTRINNKTIQVRVSANLKKIASLSTILQLRGL